MRVSGTSRFITIKSTIQAENFQARSSGTWLTTAFSLEARHSYPVQISISILPTGTTQNDYDWRDNNNIAN